MKFYQVASVILAAFFLYGCEKAEQAAFQFSDISGATFGSKLSLTDHRGKNRTLDDFSGKVVLVFFGYTDCPDMCPTTLGNLAQVVDRLGQYAEQVQVLFVTLDPKTDQPAKLEQYVTAFNPQFLGLTGTAAAVQETAKAFKVHAKSVNTQQVLEHSTGTYIFDQSGKLRLYARYGSNADAFVHDINLLLKSS